ncbi:MAG: DUF503 domain-containing protein [Anaerolineaceae bacterium]|jgi:uncharacterized protein YlxP (DUF503 family)|nr:DUF503 domain-containing protein [Anaerolineaceae bacterium]
MALCYIELKIDLPFVQNLKEKRSVLKSIIAKTSKKFNVSIAEVDFNDYWKTAKLGIAIVAQNGKIFDPMIDTMIHFLELSYPDILISITNKENL